MRTTLTIDDDLAGILQRRSRELGKSFKELVNNALRKGLADDIQPGATRAVVVRPHDFGPAPALDMDRLNQLVDELETEDYLAKSALDDPSRR